VTCVAFTRQDVKVHSDDLCCWLRNGGMSVTASRQTLLYARSSSFGNCEAVLFQILSQQNGAMNLEFFPELEHTPQLFERADT